MAPTTVMAVQRRARLKSRWLWALALTTAVSVLAAGAASVSGEADLKLAFAVLALAGFMLPYFAYATTSVSRDASLWLRRQPAALAQVVLFFVGIYLVYAIGTQSFAWIALAKVTAFVGVPALLAYTAGPKQKIVLQDWLAVLCIWLPFDFGWLKSIWTWPAGEAAYILNTAMAVDLAVILFTSFRSLPPVNFRFRLEAREAGLALAALAGFMLLALPVGLGTGFLTIHPQLAFPNAVITPFAILIFIAIPEELLFRGLIQNMLQRSLGKPLLALLITAVLFGASHLNNGPSPDVRYFLLASVAGFFYGWVYQRSRSIIVPAMLHAAVDALWVSFFHV